MTLSPTLRWSPEQRLRHRRSLFNGSLAMLAKEFEQLKVRDEEMTEPEEAIHEYCDFPPRREHVQHARLLAHKISCSKYDSHFSSKKTQD